MAITACRLRDRVVRRTLRRTSRTSIRGCRFRRSFEPNDLILKSELADFLECTRLDFLRPGADITVTSPGAYADLIKHIEVHHYFMGLDQKRDVPFEEAVTHWYDTVFLPVVEIIRKGEILSEFPNRTHADLYLWILRHRAELEKQLHWESPHGDRRRRFRREAQQGTGSSAHAIRKENL